MSFAICLNVPNHLHFKKPLNIYAEFIPQILFMESLFGYLVITIIYKWSIDWYAKDAHGDTLRNSPPGLLNMLIYMFLSPGNVSPDEQLYSGQPFVQTVLLLLAVCCVPWMLLLKPYMLWKEHKKIKGQGYQGVGQHDDDEDGEDGQNGHTTDPEMEEEHVSRLLRF